MADQAAIPDIAGQRCEGCLGLLVDGEITERENQNMTSLPKVDALMILGDGGEMKLGAENRMDLLEYRHGRRSTIPISQLPI